MASQWTRGSGHPWLLQRRLERAKHLSLACRCALYYQCIQKPVHKFNPSGILKCAYMHLQLQSHVGAPHSHAGSQAHRRMQGSSCLRHLCMLNLTHQVAMQFRDAVSHSLHVLSSEPDSSKVPSEDNAKERTAPVCPWSTFISARCFLLSKRNTNSVAT